MFVYPKPGVLVRDPDKRDLIPEDGRNVDEASPYWIRRLADEDVTTEAPAVVALPAPRAGAKTPASTDTESGSNNA
jgi:hypothetical protein